MKRGFVLSLVAGLLLVALYAFTTRKADEADMPAGYTFPTTVELKGETVPIDTALFRFFRASSRACRRLFSSSGSIAMGHPPVFLDSSF